MHIGSYHLRAQHAVRLGIGCLASLHKADAAGCTDSWEGGRLARPSQLLQPSSHAVSKVQGATSACKFDSNQAELYVSNLQECRWDLVSLLGCGHHKKGKNSKADTGKCLGVGILVFQASGRWGQSQTRATTRRWMVMYVLYACQQE